jgi:PIN domain nuclease of toxin-antitoxin system
LRLLLDTHVLLWWFAGEPLVPEAKRLIAAPDSEVFVSAASPWEAEIKAQMGKLTVSGDLAAQVARDGFIELQVSFAHGVTAARLPQHHRDPFDRLLVAQAQLEGLTIVTRDPVFDRYPVAVLKA